MIINHLLNFVASYHHYWLCCRISEEFNGGEELYKVKDIYHYDTLDSAFQRLKGGHPIGKKIRGISRTQCLNVFSYAFELKICALKESKKKIETTRVFDLQQIITMKTHLSIHAD